MSRPCSDLAAWLRQQLDDDERVARAAADNDHNLEWGVTHDALGQRFTVRTASNRPVLRGRIADSEANEDGVYDPHATFDPSATTGHAARWDPARVLAEVKAKRRILTELQDADSRKLYYERDGEEPFVSEARAEVETLHKVIRFLARPYAGREGWRDEWRV